MIKKKRILLVEDEKNIRNVVKMNLELEGYDVVTVGNGKKAMEEIPAQHFDLILLDIMLPDLNGFTVCEKIRLTKPKLPIIMLTAKDSPQDRVQGLKLGADDYLVKPFNLEELLLRVQKLLERSQNAPSKAIETYHFGGNEINLDSFEATGVAGPFRLTKKEALLLKLMIDREGQVVSRTDILQLVWGYDVYPSTRTIDNFILSFRKYFEEDPKNPKHFKSIRGIGYRFVKD